LKKSLFGYDRGFSEFLSKQAQFRESVGKLSELSYLLSVEIRHYLRFNDTSCLEAVCRYSIPDKAPVSGLRVFLFGHPNFRGKASQSIGVVVWWWNYAVFSICLSETIGLPKHLQAGDDCLRLKVGE
jgi:hypothetical protein